MDPELRPSSKDVKLMPFFQTIDWDNLQVMEPPFIPQPENATDTGYFEGKHAECPLVTDFDSRFLFCDSQLEMLCSI